LSIVQLILCGKLSMEVILYLCKYTVLWNNVYISTGTLLSLPLHYCVNKMYNGQHMSVFAFSPHSYWADMDEGWYWGSVVKVVMWIYLDSCDCCTVVQNEDLILWDVVPCCSDKVPRHCWM